MRSNRSILSIKYTPASSAVGRAVGGFLRYVHYRDHEQQGERARGAAGLVRYVAYRDQASPQGRLFTRDRVAGDRERKELVRFVRRSLQATGVQKSNLRAVYRFVLSPEDARGLDLRQLARVTVRQLESDIGEGGMPPWIAAEHRNTAHPHVHIVMAARREMAPGVFRRVDVTRQRLARMKHAMSLEMERQRGMRKPSRSLESRLMDARRDVARGRTDRTARLLESSAVRERLAPHDPLRRRRNPGTRFLVAGPGALRRLFQRLARMHQRELAEEGEREEWRREQSRRRRSADQNLEKEAYA